MAITLIHCPYCKYAMSAEDRDSAPLTCPHCGKQFSLADTDKDAADAFPKAIPFTIEELLSQAEQAMQAQEYLLCLDAANAALSLDKGAPDALFYSQAALAFTAGGIDAERMRGALERAESAMDANEYSDTQRADAFSRYLLVVLDFLRAKRLAAKACLENEYCTEQEISRMREALSHLFELCLNSVGFLTEPMLRARPAAESRVLDLVEEGETLLSDLKASYKYYDFPTGSYLTAHAGAPFRTLCQEGSAQLAELRTSLPSVRDKRAAVQRAQDASRSSVQSFWAQHEAEQSFLYAYLQKSRLYRMLEHILAGLLFLGLIVGWALGLKALVHAGISRFLYTLCIFGLMVAMTAYWIFYAFLSRKLRFRENANAARRLLASPLGKEAAIQAFIEKMQKTPEIEKPSREERRKFTRKVLAASSLIAAAAVGVCLLFVCLIAPAINLARGKKAIAAEDPVAAVTYLQRAGNYGSAKQLLEEQLALFRERALSYDARAAAYNNTIAVRDATGDVYSMEFSSTAFPDVVLTNAESFLLTQNFLIGLRADGFVSYSQYTNASDAVPPDVSAWSEIVSLGKLNNTVVGFQEDGTIVYPSAALDAATLARLHNKEVAGVFDKFGDIAVRTDGTAALPSAGNYSYADRVAQVFHQMAKWQNLAIVKGDITNHFVGLTRDGRVYAVAGWFDASFGQLNVSSWRNVVDIAAGESHTVGLLADGTVVATGSNSYGQCDVSEWRDIVAIEAGNNFTMGIASDGTVYLTGHESKTYVPRGMSEICRLAEEDANGGSDAGDDAADGADVSDDTADPTAEATSSSIVPDASTEPEA